MEAIIFYKSFFDGIEDLEEKQQLNLYRAIMYFAFKNEEIELNGIEKTIFKLIKPQLEASINNFNNGKKGGRPKKNININSQEYFKKIETLEKFDEWLEWWQENDDEDFEKWKDENKVSDELLTKKIQEVKEYYSKSKNHTKDFKEALKKFIINNKEL